jgi:hypothetical protein|eukprot:COSAG06_NODE_5818_length_3257_cov_38.925586_3_plen_97_part_00
MQEVVLPEVLIERMAANTGRKQQCPMPSGAWADQAGDLPKCWLPGDGQSCVFECERVVTPAVPIPVRCNLDQCSNLTLAKSKLHFLCPNGEVCAAE